MNEKELQEIEEGIPNGDLTHDMVYDLIAEVRLLNKTLEAMEKQRVQMGETIETSFEGTLLYKDLYTNTNVKNMVYKVALEEISNLTEDHLYMGCGEEEEAMCFKRAEDIANKALEGETNEKTPNK